MNSSTAGTGSASASSGSRIVAASFTPSDMGIHAVSIVLVLRGKRDTIRVMVRPPRSWRISLAAGP